MQKNESIEAQVYEIMEYAKSNNFTVVKTFTDRAKSGRCVEKRDGFLEMIDFCKERNNNVSIVLCHKIDRFARDKADYYHYKKLLSSLGISIHFVADKIDTSEKTSAFSEAFLSVMSQMYSENLANEVMKGLKNNARKCRHTGGVPCLGYNVNPKTKLLEINEDEKEIVYLIFDLYGRFGYSYSQVANEVNKKGYKTKRGNSFTANSIYDIIRNPKYNGVYTYNVRESKNPYGKRNNRKIKSANDIIRIEGGCPKIIDDALWELCQDRLNRTEKTNNIRQYESKEQYLLKNKIYCECGRKMYGNRRRCGRAKQPYVTYVCSGKKQKTGCKNKEINKTYIEKFVVNQLISFIFSKNNLSALTQELNEYVEFLYSDYKNEILNIKKKIKGHKQKLNNLYNAIENGIMQTSLEDRICGHKTKIKKLKEQLSVLSDVETPEFCENDILCEKNNFKKMIMKNDFLAQKLIDTYVEKVIVGSDDVEVLLNVDADVPDKYK